MSTTQSEHVAPESPNESVISQIDRELVLLLRRAEAAIARKPAAERLVRSGYLLLSELEQAGPLGIGALAETTQVDVSTASRQVVPLEQQGLVRRLSNPADRRRSLVEITQLGLDRVRAAREERRRALLEILQDWPERDRARLAQYLARLNAAVAERQTAS